MGDVVELKTRTKINIPTDYLAVDKILDRVEDMRSSLIKDLPGNIGSGYLYEDNGCFIDIAVHLADDVHESDAVIQDPLTDITLWLALAKGSSEDPLKISENLTMVLAFFSKMFILGDRYNFVGYVCTVNEVDTNKPCAMSVIYELFPDYYISIQLTLKE